MSEEKEVILVLFNDFQVENVRHAKLNLIRNMDRKQASVTQIGHDIFDFQNLRIIFKNFDRDKSILNKFENLKTIFIQDSLIKIYPSLKLVLNSKCSTFYTFDYPTQILSDLEGFWTEFLDTSKTTAFYYDPTKKEILTKSVEGYMIGSNYYQYFSSKEACIQFHINKMNPDKESLIIKKQEIEKEINEIDSDILFFQNL